MTVSFEISENVPVIQIRSTKSVLSLLVDTGSSESDFSPNVIQDWAVPPLPLSQVPGRAALEAPTSLSQKGGSNRKVERIVRQGNYLFVIPAIPDRLLVYENSGIFTPDLAWTEMRPIATAPRKGAALLGMSFWLQFDRLIFDFQRNRLTMVGDRFHNLISFTDGGTIIPPGAVHAITVPRNTVVMETLYLGAAEHFDRASQQIEQMQPPAAGEAVELQPDHKTSLVCFPGAGLRLALPQGYFELGDNDLLLAYPFGTLAIWNGGPRSARAAHGDGSGIPDELSPEPGLTELEEMTSGFTSGLPGYTMRLDQTGLANHPWELRCWQDNLIKPSDTDSAVVKPRSPALTDAPELDRSVSLLPAPSPSGY